MFFLPINFSVKVNGTAATTATTTTTTTTTQQQQQQQLSQNTRTLNSEASRLGFDTLKARSLDSVRIVPPSDRTPKLMATPTKCDVYRTC